jgi:hypothetical protein
MSSDIALPNLSFTMKTPMIISTTAPVDSRIAVRQSPQQSLALGCHVRDSDVAV